jgi:biotin carboxylase
VIRHGSSDSALPGEFFCKRFVERDDPLEAWLEQSREVNKIRPVGRVVAFAENEQLVAAIIAADLELDDHHDVNVARAVADKIEMRRRLVNSELGTVGFMEAQDVDAISRFVRAYPRSRWLVKPAMGTGGRGVSELVNPHQSESAFTRAFNVPHPIAGTHRVMVEEFKPGRQLSVECISENGEHRVLAITQKYTDERSFAEVGHCVPAELPAEVGGAVAESTIAALDALGVRYGPTHTELVLARSGQVDLIETHTRLAGHGIPHLVAAATGIDMYDLTFAQVAGASVLSRLPEAPTRAGSAQAVWFGYSPVHGRVCSIKSATESDAQIQVLVSKGDIVTADMTRTGRIVAARASASTEAEAVRKASQAVTDMTVVIECSMTAQLLGY